MKKEGSKEISKGKKSNSVKKISKNSDSNKISKNVEKILVENFISMQKIMSTLVVKFDKLEKQISSLLNLFEDSAKTLAEKEINLELKGDEEKQKEILENLKMVLDQNKLIAKGITLMYESGQKNGFSSPEKKEGFMPSKRTNFSVSEDKESVSPKDFSFQEEEAYSKTPSFMKVTTPNKKIIEEETKDSGEKVNFSI